MFAESNPMFFTFIAKLSASCFPHCGITKLLSKKAWHVSLSRTTAMIKCIKTILWKLKANSHLGEKEVVQEGSGWVFCEKHQVRGLESRLKKLRFHKITLGLDLRPSLCLVLTVYSCSCFFVFQLTGVVEGVGWG